MGDKNSAADSNEALGADEARAALAAGLEAFGRFSSVWWHPPLLMAVGLRVRLSNDHVRYPVALLLDEEADRAYMRMAIRPLLAARRVCVHTPAQTSLSRLFAEDGPLLLDLMDSPEGVFPHVRQLASIRAVPGASLPYMKDNEVEYKEMKGDCALILRAAGADAIGTAAMVLEIERPSGSTRIHDGEEHFENVGKSLDRLLKGRTFTGQADDLPDYRFLDMTQRQGFHLLFEIASFLDGLMPEARCQDAVKACLEGVAALACRTLPDSRRRAILAARLLEVIRSRKADGPGERHREDLLAAAIRNREPEVFPNLDHTALGRALGSWKVGGVNLYGRCRFESSFHGYIVPTAEVQARIRHIAGDEYEDPAALSSWVAKTFGGRPAAKLSEIQAALAAAGKAVSGAALYTLMETMPGVVRSTPDCYDLTGVVPPQGGANEPA